MDSLKLLDCVIKYLEKHRPASNKKVEANTWFFALMQARALRKEIVEAQQNATILCEQYVEADWLLRTKI